MIFSVKQYFRGLVLLICLASTLTLSINDEIKADGKTFLTSALNESFIGESYRTKHQILPLVTQSTFAPIKSTLILDKNATPSVAGEGGPIKIVFSNQQTSNVSHFNIVGNLNIQNDSNEEANVLYMKGKDNTQKIITKKGINKMPNIQDDGPSSTTVTLSSDIKLIIESSTIESIIDTKIDITKINVTDRHTNYTLNTIVNNTLSSVSQYKLSTDAPLSSLTIQEHKPKPTATVIEPNSDEHMYVPHMKGPRLGMPKKIDYVLPVIVTLIAVPVLGAIIFLIYKQGRDYWDKRHYRRMDFLIDGMYND